MTPDPFGSRTFPPLPAYGAVGAPVLLTPIAGSCERLCVAVVAAGEDGAWQIATLIDEAKARCLVGDQAESLTGFARIARESLSAHLQGGAALEAWQAPIGGLALGQTERGRVRDLPQMLRMLARDHAFLSTLADFAPDGERTEDSTDDTDRWPEQVRAAVVALRPPLSGWFNRRLRLAHGGAETRFDYLGERLAAQLGRLIPGPGIASQVRTAKAKLWDLEALRDGDPDLLERPNAYELILYRPGDDDPAHSERSIARLHEALQELESAGDRQDLRVRQVDSAEQAAARIIEAEAA